MSKYVDMIGWDDAPHLCPPNITPEELDELEAGMLPHQRQARRTGRPSLGSGAVYPVDEEGMFIAPFVIPEHFPRAYGFDVGWNKTACLFGAHDPDTDIFYLTHEYYVGEQEPIVHAYSIKAMQAWRMMGAIDPAAEHSSKRDGKKLRQEYELLGLELVYANNAVAAGLHHCLVLMQSGRLKVFSTLENWRKEFRLYRRNEKGKIVKENDHLMDCMRYLLFTDGLMRTRPIPAVRRGGGGEW